MSPVDRKRDGGAPPAVGDPPEGDAAAGAATSEVDYGFTDWRELAHVRGYVVNRRTGEVLSSIVSDVIRERREGRK